MNGNDHVLREWLHTADAARPLPPARPLSTADLQRLLRRRRTRQFASSGLLVATCAALALWFGPRPLRAPLDAGPGAASPRTANLPFTNPLMAAHQFDAALHRARLDIERAAMASLCFSETLATIDRAAAERQRTDVARLFPDTAAAAAARQGSHR
jgi:hypothetical protein